MPDPRVQRLSWADFLTSLRWRQGEHVSLIGPTGGGKTTCAKMLLPIRQYVCVLATKPKDELLTSFKRDGYTIVNDWPPADFVKRAVFWPSVKRLRDNYNQADAIYHCLDTVYQSGGWCLYADEIRYLTQTLKLKQELEIMWLQGRSLGVSLVASTQRPAWVPLEMYSQATHLFLWRDTDKRNLNRLGEIGGVDTDLVSYEVARLPKHDMLYVNTRDGTLAITNTHK